MLVSFSGVITEILIIRRIRCIRGVKVIYRKIWKVKVSMYLMVFQVRSF